MYKDPFTGLYHTHFREYDPVHGRWLSHDPAGYVDGLNPYGMYAGINGIDPTGLQGVWYKGWGDAIAYIYGDAEESVVAIGTAIIGSPLDSYKIVGNYYKGMGQGGLNSIQGAQDIVVGIGDLAYQYHPVSISLKLSGVDIGQLESHDWARGTICDTSDNVHNASKIFGGEGTVTLATLGIAELIQHLGKLKYARELKNAGLADDFVDDALRQLDDVMPRPHEHHIVYKKGIGKSQQELVEEGQKILLKYNIDPIKGSENLIKAPNIKGQHTLENIEEVVQRLKDADAAGATREDIVELLLEMGKKAALRR